MAMQITYPELQIGTSPTTVELLEGDQACSLTGGILGLIVKSYGAQFEGDGNLLPFGALAARYNTDEAAERFSQEVIPKVYDHGGAYAVIREPSDQNRLVSVLKMLPGQHIEERFSGMLGVGEILTAPEHQAKGMGAAILHAYLKFAAPQYQEARLVLDAFIGNPVNAWYQDMGFVYEEPSGSTELGPGLKLLTQYMVTPENIVASGIVEYLENRQPILLDGAINS
jgi:GNAT superfamily N-acetyltransferase